MARVIAQLRDIVPIRPLSLPEAMRIAELQACQLLKLSGVDGPPVPEAVIADLPTIQIERIRFPGLSGAAEWSHGRWLIVINGSEPVGRQRFSIGHEFKHVLDNPFITGLYSAAPGISERERGEQVCDYFAGCLLMPRAWLKQRWSQGDCQVSELAQRFGVSRTAIQVRLLQIGLTNTLWTDPPPSSPSALPSQHRRLTPLGDAQWPG